MEYIISIFDLQTYVNLGINKKYDDAVETNNMRKG